MNLVIGKTNTESGNRIAAPRPTAPKPCAENIPDLLKAQPNWCIWKYSWRDGRWTKVPLQAHRSDIDGRPLKARSNDSTTWTNFTKAVRRYETLANSQEVDGIGFFLSGDFVGVDVDKCLTEAGLSPEAQTILNTLNSYAELSPSGNGLRVFCRGTLPSENGKPDYRNGPFEIYDNTTFRFLTVTGRRLPESPETVEERQAALAQVHSQFIARPKEERRTTLPPLTNPSFELHELLERAFTARNGEKFQMLWEGSWREKFQSQSEADLALCSMLAFYCGPDPERIDEAFRQSGLMRDKWEDRPSYRDRTIQMAIEGCDEFYRWDFSNSEVAVGEIVKPPVLEFDVEEPQPKPGPSEAIKAATKKMTEPPKRKWRGFRPAEVMQWVEPNQQIENHWLFPSNVMLFGGSGSGKSFVALDMAFCIATGRKLFGRFNVQQGPVVYLCSEGRHGMKRRLEAWCTHYGVDPKELNDFIFITQTFDLREAEPAAELMEGIVFDLGMNPSLVVVDTLSRNMGGSDRNDEDAKAYVASCDLLQQSLETTVLSIHHTGWEAGHSRGASNFKDSADTQIKITKDTESRIEVSCAKQKDMAEFEPYYLTKKVVRSSAVWLPENRFVVERDQFPEKQKQLLEFIIKECGAEPFDEREIRKRAEKAEIASDKTLNRYMEELMLKRFLVIHLGGPKYRVNFEACPEVVRQGFPAVVNNDEA